MHEFAVNWWAVAAAVASNFLIGGLWYSPPLFLKPWLSMAGVSKSVFNTGLPRALIGDLVASFIMAFILARYMRSAGVADLAHGLLFTFWIWLGFVATVQLASVTYEHKPLKYFAINAGYRLVTMMAMGAILTLLS